jgi:hypothetical protein
VTPTFEVRKLTDQQVLDLVKSLNLTRRHLNESQRAQVSNTTGRPDNIIAALNTRRGDSSLPANVGLVFGYFNPPSGVMSPTNFGWNLAPYNDHRWYLVKDVNAGNNTNYDTVSFPTIFTLQK